MKLRIATSVVASISMLAALPALAQDGPALFKTKCAMCHGDQGQGKPPMAPKVAGSARVEAVLTKGGEPKAPHIKPMAALTADQVTSLVGFVKTLK
ncbi:MAG TPA: cytochrome c [Acidobacteriaceae bacterium]|jgi:mono/diheme cytochrome c family protein